MRTTGFSINRPIPSSLVPLFQNEFKCETFHMKMSSACSFIFIQIKVIFMRMVSLRLALKQRHYRTHLEIKRPIVKWCMEVYLMHIAVFFVVV